MYSLWRRWDWKSCQAKPIVFYCYTLSPQLSFYTGLLEHFSYSVYYIYLSNLWFKMSLGEILIFTYCHILCSGFLFGFYSIFIYWYCFICSSFLNRFNNEWMNEESWMRGQQTCPLAIHFNMWTVSSDVSIQRCHWQPLSVHLWAYCTHPAHDVNDVMSEGWPQHRGLCPLLFSNSGVGFLRPTRTR